MLTNRINVTYNIENIDADFDIFRVEKANKDYYKYNILDSAVYEFKAAAVQWTFGATALVLFRKGEVNSVRKLWEGVLELSEVRDVFTGEAVVPKQYDVDHFIPWSFVMNDELWNLMPMDSSLNSSKSNKLPKWDPFFEKFAANQYLLYGLIHEKAGIYKLFEGCYKDNLHSIWAGRELYRKGNSKEEFYNILQKNIRPIYDSARRQGYEIWNMQ